MEDTVKWIAGILLSIAAIVSTWMLARINKHNKTENDIFDKLEQLERLKSDKCYVDSELKKITDNINYKLESHVHESQAVDELLLKAMDVQGDLIKSMDDNIKIVLKSMIQK